MEHIGEDYCGEEKYLWLFRFLVIDFGGYLAVAALVK
jgi:hypothetical protein